MAGALEGIRVLDFTRYQQGPVGTVMLAELGAEIWKIEARVTGDLGRQSELSPDGYSRYFEAHSRGKRSITLDVRTSEGREVALRLSAHVDVVADNFRPGVMDRLGLGYTDFKARNPDIIVASASALGAEGPLGSRPGYDIIGQAMGGVMTLQASGPDAEPHTLPGGFADQVGGMQLCIAILSAIIARDRQGIGQHVETSLLGSQVHLQGRYLLRYLHDGVQHHERRRRTPTFTFYQGSDGAWLVIGVIDQENWDRLCLVLEAEELLTDPRFSDRHVQLEHREALEAELEVRFRRRPRAEWLERLAEADIPHAPVNSFEDLAAMEQAWANGYLAEVVHPHFGPIRVHGLPWRFSATPAVVPSAAPDLGADTNDVLLGVGFSDKEVAALRESEVI